MLSRRKWICFVVAFACVALSAALSFVGCSGGSASGEASSGSANADSAACLTVTPGVLTVATGDPAYPPYVMNDDPDSGEGFEAALTYAIAEQMGFKNDQVVWVRTGFDEAITPGAKDWDMNIQQFSITDERKQAVDFSSPYFTPSQSVIVDAAEGHDKYVNATSCADLSDAVLGAAAGSTSIIWGQKAINDNIQIFNSNADAANALNAHQIDGLITDTPTAVYMANPDMEELDSAKLVGQIPNSEGEPFAYLLPKGSELTPYVTAAIEELNEGGVIQQLTKTWMSTYTSDVPVLE